MVSTRVLRGGTIAVAAYLALGSAATHALELTSTDIANGAALHMAQVDTQCGGENRSPALSWSGAPKGTERFAVTMFDSDANGGRGFWHWVMVDIPAATQTLAAGLSSAAALPNGAIQAENDFGRPGYGGACPPPGSGTHHYTVTVFALSARVPLSTRTDAPAIAVWLKNHALATAALTATYRR